MSSWNGFLNTVTFIRHSPSTESGSTLMNSIVQWRSITLRCFHFKELASQFQPTHLNSSVTELTLKEGKHSWSWVRDLIGRFPKLEKFSIVNCERIHIMDDEGFFQNVQSVATFTAFRGRVTSLKFEVHNYKELLFYIRQFIHKESKLNSLHVISKHENYNYEDKTYDRDYDELTIAVCQLANCCSESLKVLSMDLNLRNSLHFLNFFLRLEQRNVKLDLNELHFHSKWDDTRPALPEKLFMPYIKFLKTQQSLKYLTVPRLNDAEGRLVSVFPLILTGSFEANESNLSVDLCKHLHHVKAMKIKCVTIGCNFLKTLDNKVYPKLRDLKLDGTVTGFVIPYIIKRFPNLVKLSISCSPVVEAEPRLSITDVRLQWIIRDLPNLQVLNLSPCDSITDYGVSGIFPQTCDKISESKTLYSDQTISFPEIPGHPLCSLKCKLLKPLEKY